MPVETVATAYTRLPGRGRRLTARFVSGEAQRLYLGDDHLLVLRRLGYEESSKRYALSDIQAITVQSNADRTVLSAFLLLLMMIFAALGLFAMTQGTDPADFAMFFAYIPVAICGFSLLLNLALGPTCTVRLHTAVQFEDMTALRRQRAARKCLAILVPRIEAVQGARFSVPPQPAARASANLRQIRGNKKQAPRAIGRTAHAAAFALSAALGVFFVAELFYESAAKDIANTLLLAASMMVLLFAAIRQINSTLPGQTRVLTWTLFVLNGGVSIGAMYVLSFITAFSAESSADGSIWMTAGVLAPGQEDPRWFDAILAASGGVTVILALFGLLSIRGYKLVVRHAADARGAPPP